MRFLHTADLHIGETLFGVDRLQESSAALDEIEYLARDEHVDLVIIAGDEFDNPTPAYESQELLYKFLRKLDENQIRTVLISGNHDGQFFVPSRTIFDLTNIVVFEKPRTDAVLRFRTKGDEPVTVVGLPYPNERLVAHLASADEDIHVSYAQQVSDFMRALSRNFSDDTVNIFTAHLMMSNARISNTERELSVLPFYTVPTQRLPDNASYVALGHVHRMQQMVQSPVPAYYSGSILRTSFAEEGTPKGVMIVDCDIHGATAPKFIELTSPLSLYSVSANLSSYQEILETYAYKQPCYVKLSLQDGRDQYSIAASILASYPFVLKVELPQAETSTDAPTLTSIADTSVENILGTYQKYSPNVSEAVLTRVADIIKEMKRNANQET